MSDRESGPSDLVAGHLADQMTAFEHQLDSANSPGSLDGLFAHHVLQHTTISSFTWDVSPLNGRWLEQNADHLITAPQLAALGYGLAHAGTHSIRDIQSRLVAGLHQLMRRDPYPADGITFLHDPRQLIGVALAADATDTESPDIAKWLHNVIEDSRFRVDIARQDLVRRHVRTILGDQPSTVSDTASIRDVTHLALLHWMVVTGTVQLAEPATDLSLIQRSILSGLLKIRPGDLSVPDVALLRAAAEHIIDSMIDSAVLNRNHIGVVLRRFAPAMRRWRWDDPAKVQDPIQWAVTSEREVQDIVWILLRGVFDDLIDEEPLPKLGHSSYRSDFGIPHLGVLVEIKYVRSATEFKKVEKEVYEDSVAYLTDRSNYTKIVVFIYDASASVQEHATTIDALRRLDNVVDVIITSRPSQLPPPDTSTRRSTTAKRRQASTKPSRSSSR